MEHVHQPQSGQAMRTVKIRGKERKDAIQEGLEADGADVLLSGSAKLHRNWHKLCSAFNRHQELCGASAPDSAVKLLSRDLPKQLCLFNLQILATSLK